MKKALLIFAFIVVLLLAEQVPHNNMALAQANQTLVVGTTDSVETSLDPANAYDYFGWEIIRSVGSGLVDFRPGATGPSDIIPDLAANWSVSSNGLQWTFSLRQGVKYDDGTEFNASDVKYTFDRDMQMADPNGAFVGIGFSDIIQDVTVVDTYTVRFDLKIPFSPFLSLIASEECVMVDPKYAPMHGTSWNYTTDEVLYTTGDARASNPMGLGPYTLSNWTRVAGKDSQMVLTADPNYWNASAGIPKTKNIIIDFYADSSALALAISGGQVDIAFRQLDITDINTMKTNSNLAVWQGPGAFIQYMCFQEKYAPFNETNIRRAVGAAINRTALVNTVFQGQAQNLYSLIPNGMAGHTDAFQNLGDPNYTETQELLTPFGYNATNKLTFDLYYETSGHYPQSAQQAQVLKSSIEASGVIFVNLLGLDWAGFGSARRSETMQAFILGWYPDYIDPDDYIFPFLDSAGGSWLHMNYANPQMDLLIESARGNPSLSVRSALYSQIQDLMVTDSPIIPLYQGFVYAVSKKEITGIHLDITQEFRYELIASTGPQIQNVSITPTCPYPYVPCNATRANEPVLVTTNVSDPLGTNSVATVLLTYRVNAEDWWNTSMTYNTTSGLWTRLIPGQQGNNTIELFVSACDVAGNWATSSFTSFKVKPLPLGDVNGDGITNMRDIAFLILHFNEKTLELVLLNFNQHE